MQKEFPRGLIQPEGAFRFSADALLLAAFARPAPGMSVLDLGTGCGVVALGLLLRCEDIRVTGVDVRPELTACAADNAVRMGFADRANFCRADVRKMAEGCFPEGMVAGAFGLVTANPPYRVLGEGRLPASEARRTALFGDPGLLEAFAAAGRRALAEDGVLAMVFPGEREEELSRTLETEGLFGARLRRVLFRRGGEDAGKRGRSRGLILVEAVKKAPHAVTREEPLVLHEGEEPGITAAALSFCPWLEKRPGSGAGER